MKTHYEDQPVNQAHEVSLTKQPPPAPKQTHTPGPWKQMPTDHKDIRGGLVILGADGKALASAWSDNRPECGANARLIATAPELLDAIQHAVKIAQDGGVELVPTKKWKDLIARATKAEEPTKWNPISTWGKP